MKKLYLPILFSLSLFTYCHAQKWIPQGQGVLPDSFGIIGLSSVDDSTVWALAFDLVLSASNSNFSNILIKSTDGGVTWKKYVLDQFNNQIVILSAVSSDVAWLAASNSQGVRHFYQTVNGGETWVEKFSFYVTPNIPEPPIMKFVDEQKGYFIDLNSNRSGGTDSGGEIWYSNPTSISLSSNEYFGYPSPGNWFEAKGDTIIFGTNKRIFRSINGGMSWATVHNFAGNHEIQTVAFDNTGYGLTGSSVHSTPASFSFLDSTVFLKSEDFGKTWASLPAADFPLTSLAQVPDESKTFIGVSGVFGWWLPDEQHSWASAYTTDGGVTWDIIDRDIPYSCISFVSKNTGWVGAVGNYDYGPDKPAVFKWEPPEIISTASRALDSAITVSPNPFSNFLKIESEKFPIESVACFNTQGQRMAAIQHPSSLISSLTPHSSSLSLTVRDNGPGIPPEHLPRIFDRFYQADSTSTRKGEGTGIGLAMVKELVKLMGGEIGAESEAGKGAKFTILLPVKQSAQKAPTENAEVLIPIVAQTILLKNEPAQSAPDVPHSELPLVLLIEDNADVITYLTSFLSGDYRVATATNGKQGIEKAIELTPDLVVSDVMMPEKDGFEVCATLKTDERTSHIPVILLTAKAGPAAKLEGLTHGADAYLAKPFNKEELLVRMEKLIELRRRMQERYARNDIFLKNVMSENPTPEDLFLQKLVTIVEQNLSDEHFGLPDLCRQAGLSRSQLFRKLKALTGKSTTHFIRSIRLAKGRELLETSDMTVSEVAYSTGFSNLAYFSTMFKAEFGMMPSDVRKG